MKTSSEILELVNHLKSFENGFAKAAATGWNHALEPLDDKIGKYIGNNPVRLDGRPRASGIFDTVSSYSHFGRWSLLTWRMARRFVRRWHITCLYRRSFMRGGLWT